ncbi:hypothetical protein [Haloarchaeobius sp. DFWS5]|uniref:hypothetical protein n=1 Tax=Haloarchaeobius sp. DFWS5 TaxID=3446114 RepID=UPI003EB7F41F
MNRRRFLAATAGALSIGLAGCGHPPPHLYLDLAEADDDSLRKWTTMQTTELRGRRRIVANRLLADESTTYLSRSDNPELSGGTQLSHGDSVSTVETTNVGTETRDGYQVTVNYYPDEPAPEDASVLPFEDLSQVERRLFEELDLTFMHEYANGESTSESRVFPPDEAYDDTTLLPTSASEALETGYDYLRFEGRDYRLELKWQTSKTWHRFEYAIDDQTTTSAHLSSLRRQYRFTLDSGSLSERQREILLTAIDGGDDSLGYHEDDPISDAYQGLVDSFQQHIHFEPASGRHNWLVTYDGDDYLASMQDETGSVLDY